MLRVNGGPTGAGTRIVREAVGGWHHNCRATRLATWLAGTHTRCPDCGSGRAAADKTVSLKVACQCSQCDPVRFAASKMFVQWDTA